MYRVNPDVRAINVKTTLAVVFAFMVYAQIQPTSKTKTQIENLSYQAIN